MTSVLLVHPGASFSTHDVFTGIAAGLRANGVLVHEYRLDHQLVVYNQLIDCAIDHDVLTNPLDPFVLASAESIPMTAHYKPDAILVVSGGNFHPVRVIQMRGLAANWHHSMPVAVYCTESPYFNEASFALAYDIILTNERNSLAAFAPHERVHYLRHAFNPAVHQPGPADPDKVCDAFFVGTGFDERKRLFDGVNWDGIHFERRGYLWDKGPDAIVTNTELLTPKSVTPNEETAAWYRSARININHHRTTTMYGSGEHIAADAAASLGPRAYEIAACRGFQLMDDSRSEACEVFGDTLATYRSGDSADLERRIRYWLNHPDRREETARLQHAAIQPHSWTARAAELLEIVLA